MKGWLFIIAAELCFHYVIWRPAGIKSGNSKALNQENSGLNAKSGEYGRAELDQRRTWCRYICFFRRLGRLKLPLEKPVKIAFLSARVGEKGTVVDCPWRSHTLSPSVTGSQSAIPTSIGTLFYPCTHKWSNPSSSRILPVVIQ